MTTTAKAVVESWPPEIRWGQWWLGVGGQNSGGGRREGGDGARGLCVRAWVVGREGGERDMVWWGVGLCVGCEPLDEMNGEDGENRTK